MPSYEINENSYTTQALVAVSSILLLSAIILCQLVVFIRFVFREMFKGLFGDCTL